MHKSYWLGLIGGMLGILSGAFGSNRWIFTFHPSIQGSRLVSFTFWPLLPSFFSILGIVGGHLQHERGSAAS